MSEKLLSFVVCELFVCFQCSVKDMLMTCQNYMLVIYANDMLHNNVLMLYASTILIC